MTDLIQDLLTGIIISLLFIGCFVIISSLVMAGFGFVVIGADGFIIGLVLITASTILQIFI